MLQRRQAQSIYNPTTDTEKINSSMWANGQDIFGGVMELCSCIIHRTRQKCKEAAAVLTLQMHKRVNWDAGGGSRRNLRQSFIRSGIHSSAISRRFTGV